MDVTEISAGTVWDEGGVRVTAVAVAHQPVKHAFGFVFESDGRKVAFSGDTAYCPALIEAAKGADVLYTDVWVSMGKESETAERERIFAPYQIDRKMVGLAKKDVLVLHCLPAYRGKEISAEILEERSQDIFDQAENRLHTQKGILEWIVAKPLRVKK
jgi:ornithine carbamoyltransferase